MRPSANCYSLVRQREGCRLNAYPDPATGGSPFTIGYGHTGPEVHPGQAITQDEAEKLLEQDVDKVAVQVSRLINVTLTQNEFDALVCFVYNVGIGNFAKSTMLKKLSAGDFDGAAAEFPVWSKANGKRMSGLLARREAEEKLFNA